MANRQLLVLIHIGGWSIFLFVFALIFSRFFPFGVSLFRAVLNTLPMAALFYFNLYLVDRFLEQKRYLPYVGIILLLIAGLSLLRVQINLQFPEIDKSAFLPDSENNSWWFGAVGTNLLILAMSTFYQILQNRNQVEQRNLVLIKEQNEAQLYPERHLLVVDNQPDRFYLDLRLQLSASSENNHTPNVYNSNPVGG